MGLVEGDPSTNVALWSFLFYSLSVLAAIFNLLLLLVIPLSPTLRKRVSSLFIWSTSFWYLLSAGLVTPFGFYGKVILESVPFGAPWLCQVRPFVLDVAFNMEILSLIVLAAVPSVTLQMSFLSAFSGFLDWLKHGPIPISQGWTPGMAWLLCVFVWLLSIALSIPWAFPRYANLVENESNQKYYECKKPSAAWFKWFNTIVAFSGGAVMVVIADILFVILGVRAFRKFNVGRLTIIARSELKALIFMLLKFNLFWVATWIIFLVRTSGNNSIFGSDSTLISTIGGYLHDHCELWNFLILIVFIPSYRTALKQLVTCRICGANSEEWATVGNQNGSKSLPLRSVH